MEPDGADENIWKKVFLYKTKLTIIREAEKTNVCL